MSEQKNFTNMSPQADVPLPQGAHPESPDPKFDIVPRNNHGHELPPAFESTAILSVRAGDPVMDRTNEAVLALKGYTAFRDLSEEGKQAVGQADGFLWASEAKDSLTVGKTTLDPETLSLLRCTSAADARYEIYARAMTEQTTTPAQMNEIIGAVNKTISASRTIDVPPPNAGELLNSPATNRVVERPSEVGQGPQ